MERERPDLLLIVHSVLVVKIVDRIVPVRIASRSDETCRPSTILSRSEGVAVLPVSYRHGRDMGRGRIGRGAANLGGRRPLATAMSKLRSVLSM
jgi:hypothetical protein